jgi:hypothetical protein
MEPTPGAAARPLHEVRMSRHRLAARSARILGLGLALALLVPGLARAEVPPLTAEVVLTAQDGARVKVPAWSRVREDAAVHVLELAPDRDRVFYVLMVAIEPGPTGEKIDWQRVLDNIQASASKSGRTLSLALGGAFAGAPDGFEGRTMRGTFEDPAAEKRVEIALVTLVKDGRLVTISLVSEKVDEDARAILDAVAATTTLGGAP